MQKLKLQGFNNLTKTLSFNIYDVAYAETAHQRSQYLDYIDESYNAERLTSILEKVVDIIDAKVLNIARADYDPLGASVTMLICEGNELEPDQALPEVLVAHLDKSHLTVHTYPESHPEFGVSTFRVDIDVSTCGHISPLKALNFLIESFESDIVIMDYRVRGFTRDVVGNKHYIDHAINSISEFIEDETRNRYQTIDVNVFEENLFHTKMMLQEFNVDDYLYGVKSHDIPENQLAEIEQDLTREISEIYYGRNMDPSA